MADMKDLLVGKGYGVFQRLIYFKGAPVSLDGNLLLCADKWHQSNFREGS